jgi:hypothetical protein
VAGSTGAPTLDPQPPVEPSKDVLPATDELSAPASEDPIEPLVESRENIFLANDEFSAPATAPLEPLVESRAPPAETKIDTRPLLISFFRDLDQKIQEDPNDASKIEAWLQSQISRPDYFYYFFCALQNLYALYAEKAPNHKEIHLTYRRCINSLKTLGLQRYTEETPSIEFLTQMKKEIDEQKEKHQETCKACLFVLASSL